MKKRKIVLLGSTGSVGSNVLKVIESLKGEFTVLALSARENVRLLARQANKFRPAFIGLGDGGKTQSLKQKLNYKCKIFSGSHGLAKIAGLSQADLIVIATTGISGLLPLWAALGAGKDVALANKEALVVAGKLIKKKAGRKKAQLIPMDSEHNAIFQCLENRKGNVVKKIILTASGGPFYKRSRASLKKIKPQEALRHPLWKMGAKISIDSATLINKGLEVMEAQHLFNLKLSQIEILIHPQGLVHALVELIDGSVLALLSRPDMRLPIQHALTFPERRKSSLRPIDLSRLSKLEFYRPDYQRFPGLKLALESAQLGGTMPAVFNAANEVAVALFLQNKIDFLSIPGLIKKVMARHKTKKNPGLGEILKADIWARKESLEIAKGEFLEC